MGQVTQPHWSCQVINRSLCWALLETGTEWEGGWRKLHQEKGSEVGLQEVGMGDRRCHILHMSHRSCHTGLIHSAHWEGAQVLAPHVLLLLFIH